MVQVLVVVAMSFQCFAMIILMFKSSMIWLVPTSVKERADISQQLLLQYAKPLNASTDMLK